jgi:hypothetical protein
LPRITRHICAFTAGELSPTLRGRKDTQIYTLGCEIARNVLVKPQGSATARPGLRHVAQIHALASHPGVRLLDHVFSDDQKYVVCLYHLGAKVYRDSDFALVATLVLPYHDTDLQQVDFVQLADTMLLAHPSYPLRQVVRGPAESWSTAEYEFVCGPQHKHWADPGTRMRLSSGSFGVDHSVTFTAEHGDANDVFTTAMIGETWVMAKARFVMTARTSATVAVFDQLDEIDTTDLYGSTKIKETAWTQQAATAATGYFRSIAYHQNRLALGGTRDLPYWLWFSRSNAPYDFQVSGVDAAEPIKVPASTGRLDPIRYLVPSSTGLEVYTAGGEGIVPSGIDQPLTPATIAFTPQTAFGCRFVKPVRLEDVSYFAQRDGGAVRAFHVSYGYQNQTTSAAEPITVRAAHLIDDPASVTAIPGGFGLQADFLCIANSDGTGAIMTSEPTEQVKAWADLSSGRFLVDVRAVRSRLYACTKDGAAGVAHFLEWLDPAARYDAQRDATSVSPTTAWTGFQHLAGKTADLWADGYWRGAVTVGAGGGVTTTKPYSAVSVGLPIDVAVRPMPPEMEQGTLLGVPVRPVRAHCMFLNSAALRVDGQKIFDRPFDAATTTPPQATAGVRRVYLRGWTKDGSNAPTITRDGPFPFELLSFAVDYAVGT